MRIMRHGERKEQKEIKHQGDTRMSKLRQSVLETIRIMGNYSGCHQMAERSFFLNGLQFPVCARCTGVMAGQLSALIVIPFRIPISVCIACLTVMGLDWSIQELGIKSSTNPRRFLTGILGGFGLFSLYVNIFKFFLCHKSY